LVDVCCSYSVQHQCRFLRYCVHIRELYLHIKNEVSRSSLSRVRPQTGQTHTYTERQTHRQTRPNALPAAPASGSNKGSSLRYTLDMTYLGPGYTPIFYSIMFHALIIYLFNDFTDLQHGDVYVYKEQ